MRSALPPAPPLNITVIPVSPTSVQVAFDPPPNVVAVESVAYKVGVVINSTLCGTVVEVHGCVAYQVRARLMSSKALFGEFVSETKVPRGTCVCTLEGLQPGSCYAFQV